MTEIINLTPHIVRLNDGREFQPSGDIARVSTIYSEMSDGHIPDIPTVTANFGEVIGLPEQQDGIVYIVSGMVMSACPDRMDIVAPCTGHKDCIRKDGQIYSVPGFIRNARPKTRL